MSLLGQVALSPPAPASLTKAMGQHAATQGGLRATAFSSCQPGGMLSSVSPNFFPPKVKARWKVPAKVFLWEAALAGSSNVEPGFSFCVAQKPHLQLKQSLGPLSFGTCVHTEDEAHSSDEDESRQESQARGLWGGGRREKNEEGKKKNPCKSWSLKSQTPLGTSIPELSSLVES